MFNIIGPAGPLMYPDQISHYRAMHTPHNYTVQLLLDLDWLQYEVHHDFFQKEHPTEVPGYRSVIGLESTAVTRLIHTKSWLLESKSMPNITPNVRGMAEN